MPQISLVVRGLLAGLTAYQTFLGSADAVSAIASLSIVAFIFFDGSCFTGKNDVLFIPFRPHT